MGEIFSPGERLLMAAPRASSESVVTTGLLVAPPSFKNFRVLKS